MNWKTQYKSPTEALLKSNNLIANLKMKQWEVGPQPAGVETCFSFAIV